MTCAVLIVGLPSAATCPPEKTWRAAGELRRAATARPVRGRRRRGVRGPVQPGDWANYPDVEARIAADGLVPPVVVVDGAVLSSGGKLNVSAIERAVAAALDGASVAPVEVVTRG